MVFDCGRIGQGLPILNSLDEVVRAAVEQGAVVLQAPPGTGKTTLVPPALANAFPGKVLVTSPRRVTARTAARRLAALHGEKLGGAVGYRVRGDARPGSRVEFLTPGVLVRQLLHDPELPGVSAIVLDEVHERSLDVDLVLGMAIELRTLREDLVLVLMSATVDTQRFAALVGAKVVVVPAPGFPTDISYRPLPGRAESSPQFWQALAMQAAQSAHASEHSTLVFVPGLKEVRRVVTALEPLTDLPVYPLHGSLEPKEQDRALTAQEKRIVVSTPIAESSLTVPGVRVVVDAGLARVPRRDQARGLSGLVTLSCPQASAIQRAGRAGREGPGTVVRCYSESEFQHMAAHITPEIAAADLASFLLSVRAWGTTPAEFPLLDAPPAASLAAAKQELTRIGALDEEGTITAAGRRIALIPTPPTVAATLLRWGVGAAPVIALLAKESSGDLAAQVDTAPAREVRRLEKLCEGLTKTTNPPVGVVVASCFPGRIARQVTGEEYLLAGGSRARLAPGHPLRGAQWLACADMTIAAHGEPVIHSAAELTQEQALAVFPPATRLEVTAQGATVRGVEVTSLGAIELTRTPVPVTEEQAVAALAGQVTVDSFPWSPGAAALRTRLHFARTYLGEPWPTEDSIDITVLLRLLAQGQSPTEAQQLEVLRAAIPWQHAHEVEELIPGTLEVASGRRASIDYSQGTPRVSVKLQECFGMLASPMIAGVPLTFELLSPAGRPLAVTSDLAGF